MIELRHLKTLMALRESGSLAGAAKKRFVTQSALSYQIKELETRINATVFIRKSTPLSFTQEGNRLLDLAAQILPKIVAVETELKKGLSTTITELLVGIECHSCFRWLIPVTEQFKAHFPHIDLELSSRHLFDSLTALKQGKLDVVLTSDPIEDDNITYQHLFDFEVKLFVSNQHSLAKNTFVTPSQLAGEPLLSYPVPLERLDIYRHFMAPAGVSVDKQIRCDLTSMLLQRIACKDGICALPSWSITEGHGLSLAAVRLGKHGLKRSLFGAYRQGSRYTELAQQWLNLVAMEGAIISQPLLEHEY